MGMSMRRNGRLLGRASVGCGVVCLSLAAFAGATYDASSQPGDLIVTVDADGATILVTGEDKLAVPASREYVIARAPQVSGTPTIDPASSYSPKWKIVTTETEVKLVKEDIGVMILIR